jgi:hypothetical protein
VATLQATPPKTVTIAIYEVDNQCMDLVPKPASVAAEQPIQAAIAQVLEKSNSADFSLSGYRLNIAQGTATVDLRITPGSKRKFQSLSSCEQLELFGGIRKTLTNNHWGIQVVRFTEKGQDIVL